MSDDAWMMVIFIAAIAFAVWLDKKTNAKIMDKKPDTGGIFEATHDLQQQMESSPFVPPEVFVVFLQGINKIYAEIAVLNKKLAETGGMNKP